jgi:Tfp pilus assembly protein PilO
MLAPATVTAVALAVWHLGLAPVRASHASLSAELAGRLAAARDARRVHRTLPFLEHETALVERAVSRLGADFDDPADAGLVLEVLTDLAEQDGVELTGYRPGARVSHRYSDEISAELVVDGRYQAIVRFLDSVQTMPVGLLLSKLHVVANGRAGGRGTVTMSMRASWHAWNGAAAPVGQDNTPHEFEDAEPEDELLNTLRAYRDPFVALVQPAPPERRPPATRAAGLAGIPLADVIVRGLARRGETWLAILEASGRQSFVARAHDRLADVEIVLIDADGVLFGGRSAAGGITRVRKPLHPPSMDGR